MAVNKPNASLHLSLLRGGRSSLDLNYITSRIIGEAHFLSLQLVLLLLPVFAVGSDVISWWQP